MRTTSIFEYIKLRYGSNKIRLVTTSLYIFRAVILTALFLYGPATTIAVLSTINTTLAVIIIGGIATFYTCIGGIKAVIWTGKLNMHLAPSKK
jgi:SSS family solute:Na+ symporter